MIATTRECFYITTEIGNFRYTLLLLRTHEVSHHILEYPSSKKPIVMLRTQDSQSSSWSLAGRTSVV